MERCPAPPGPEVVRPVAAREEPAMDRRMQGLDPAVQNSGEPVTSATSVTGDPASARVRAVPPVEMSVMPCAASARGERHEPGLVADRDQRAADRGEGACAHRSRHIRTPSGWTQRQAFRRPARAKARRAGSRRLLSKRRAGGGAHPFSASRRSRSATDRRRSPAPLRRRGPDRPAPPADRNARGAPARPAHREAGGATG